MRISCFTLIIGINLILELHCSAQFDFQDLDFEQAKPLADPLGPVIPADVFAASALPGWNVALGSIPQTDVLQNLYAINQASVDIFGPNYQAAAQYPYYVPGVIDGDYSVLLQEGNLPSGPTLVPASISQFGFIPEAAQSFAFKAYMTPGALFSISFNGVNLNPLLIQSGSAYNLYDVDISSYAGQLGELEFTDLVTPLPSAIGLDDITFSSAPIVPEPNVGILSVIGGLMVYGPTWLKRRREPWARIFKWRRRRI